MLEDREHLGQVAAEKRRRGQPEAGEDLALVLPFGVELQTLVAVVAQDEPVDRPVPYTPHHVFANFVAPVGVQFVVQVARVTRDRRSE